MATKDFGLIGLGVMGQNFVLNVERNGYSVCVYNRSKDKTEEFLASDAKGKNISAASTIGEFVKSLSRPRRIMLLVKAGAPVDAVIGQLSPLLEKGDLIIDGGNSLFGDSERRASELAEKGIHFLGMGVSGGEEGALWGPSLMPGGAKEAYEAVKEIMTAVAAKAPQDKTPCVTYIGPGGAGHYVKMVHNGIEYGDMQLIAETYDLMNRGLGLSTNEMAEIFKAWNQKDLSSFLIEISADIFETLDEETGRPLLDLVLDKAGQKGTGTWTCQNALELGVAVPTITAAVDARILSSMKDERVAAADLLDGPDISMGGEGDSVVSTLGDALFAAKICSYAQGMKLLQVASSEYGYKLNLAEVVKIWRAGCIIRAELLEDISNAFAKNPNLNNLLVDPHFAEVMKWNVPRLREAVKLGASLGIPLPAMGASLAYYDSYRNERLPANMIQALRDNFGAHTFERIDREGSFHAKWGAK